MKIGQIVFSKSGRDKGKVFVVLSVEDEFVFLTDGRIRPLDRPKKKKFKHVQPTNTIIGLKPEAEGLKDADIRKWLDPFIPKG